MIPSTWLTEASERISPHILRTSLTWDAAHGIFLKWENHQRTGSFNLRGALNKVLSLQVWECQQGLVGASAGNHGQGLAVAGSLVDASVTVFASDHAISAKLEAMRSLGAQVRLVPGGYAEAEAAGLAYAQSTASIWVSPYNDGQVIAGQGTLALECLEQLEGAQPEAWLVPVGGGGLISGIASALARVVPRPRLIGVQSTASPFMHAIFHRGSQSGVKELYSIADGLSGPVEDGSLTIPIVNRLVDDIVLVSEEDIALAIRFAGQYYQERIEGSAAVPLAAWLTGKIKAKSALLVISGGNIPPSQYETLLHDE
jgi:threonine dehydratase